MFSWKVFLFMIDHADTPSQEKERFCLEREGHSFQVERVNDGDKQEWEFCSLYRVLTTESLSDFFFYINNY